MPAEPGWADHAAQTLAQAGYHRGEAREAVIALLDKQGCALSAMEIERKLAKRKRRTVSRATVYRVLEELEQTGLVTRVELGGGKARFEPVRLDHHHHHLVCGDCGDIVPFEDQGLERVIRRLSNDVSFDITGHDVVLHGRCAPCSGASGS